MSRAVATLALVLALQAGPLAAVEPSEMLADPLLEARAQSLDDDLRCMQCSSESIASSNADWARDARALVRDLITEGRSDSEIRAFFVASYGEGVLMMPTPKGANMILFVAGPLMFLAGGLIAWRTLRRSRGASQPAPLSEAEKARLKALTEGAGTD